MFWTTQFTYRTLRTSSFQMLYASFSWKPTHPTTGVATCTLWSTCSLNASLPVILNLIFLKVRRVFNNRTQCAHQHQAIGGEIYSVLMQYIARGRLIESTLLVIISEILYCTPCTKYVFDCVLQMQFMQSRSPSSCCLWT